MIQPRTLLLFSILTLFFTGCDGNKSLDAGDPPDPLAPIADAGGPYTAYANESLTLAGTATHPDSDGVVMRYEWDFGGDGTWDWSSDTTGVVDHTWSKEGEYNAIFRVMSGDSLFGLDTASVVVNSRLAPVADAGGPYTTYDNESLTLAGTATHPDSNGVIVKYEWDFGGDGTWDWSNDTTGVVDHTWSTEGEHGPIFRVMSGDSLFGLDTASVVVSIPRPTASISRDEYYVTINQIFTMHSGFAPGPTGAEIVAYRWDFDKGQTPTWSKDFWIGNCVYQSPITHHVTFCVRDSDGRVGCDSAVVYVRLP
jgi:hypothetical protein